MKIKTYNKFLNEGLVSVDESTWPFGKAVYDAIADGRSGSIAVEWNARPDESGKSSHYSTEIFVKPTDDPEAFKVNTSPNGGYYAHNQYIVIIGHGIYPEFETALDRKTHIRRYRDQVQDLPVKLRKYLHPFEPQCPRAISTKIIDMVNFAKGFINDWNKLSDEDMALFEEDEAFALDYIIAHTMEDVSFEEWKKKISAKRFAKKHNL